jgi:hypothetical protein
MGLLGGERPPFGILEVDFLNKTGTARLVWDTTTLTHVTITPPDQFAAKWTMGSRSGSFDAKLLNNGDLELNFYQGSPKLKCRAVPRGETWQVSRLALLTCVGNGYFLPTGPGHSAMIVDREVFTFEDPLAVSSSGWVEMRVQAYLDLSGNLIRPIIIQELNLSRVNGGEVMEYIQNSIRRDEDYGPSGVCSQQTAWALAAGLPGGFDPAGVNTPRAVHDLVKSKALVSNTYLLWDSSLSRKEHVPVYTQELSRYYYGVKPPIGPNVRDW